MIPTDIYILIHPVTGAVYYVGKTERLDKRYITHKSQIRSAITRGFWWEHRIHYGVAVVDETNQFPTMVVVDTVRDTKSKDAEAWWIDYFLNRGYELTNSNPVRPRQFTIKRSAGWRLPIALVFGKDTYTVDQMQQFIAETKSYAEPFVQENKTIIVNCLKYRVSRMEAAIQKAKDGKVRCAL